ncbi:nitrogen regulation protein NR(II) [Acidipila sp. EB88]|uniref:two-component system sensor histidine kinase NtrB n=1 Tax=Acidipila sp. EB88 TaxID=2305226 RepID=UPI000F6011DE|nr:PAS domain S-box protein [Acidipila sp. EB88]RRA48258.1 PAS domain S-box protein [Acidipila sp. EB88]
MDARHAAPTLGILVAEPTARRLLESVCSQLELVPVILAYDDAIFRDHGGALDSLHTMELLVADHGLAHRIRKVFATREENIEAIHPALVALVAAPAEAPLRLSDLTRDLQSLSTATSADPAEGGSKPGAPEFEGVITLPQSPASVVAQLGVILFAHRAYARRYQTALDELSLNRRIFRSVTSGISIADASLPDTPLVYVNPAFELMTGYSLEEVEGRNCRFLQAGDRDQPGITLIQEALQSRRETVTLVRNYRKNGEQFWNELSLSPIRNRDGAVTHFVGIQSDVTARVEFEEALLQSEKLAAVGRLAASIAHEINNPLESVTNLLYLARYEVDAERRDYFLEHADRELRRVALITNQSLRFYKQSTRPQAIRPVDLLSAVLDVYASQLVGNGITVERRDRMCASIVCLESEIRQVLNNLVANAKDAIRESGRLLARTREATQWRTGHKGISITIADTGSGMSAETLGKLFNAFYTTKGDLGTGLGLWVSREIVLRHHGALAVRSRESQPGRPGGTVFTLFLPYQAVTV